MSYCQGDCPYCDDNQYWDWQQAPSREKCQFIGQGGEDLSEADCDIACADQGAGCFFAKNNRTGKGICVTPKSMDDKSEFGCKEMPRLTELVGATVKKVKWSPLKCSLFSRQECGWANEAFSGFDCGIQRLQCKNKVECQKSGQCEYGDGVDEWTAEKEGGICMRPHGDLTFDEDIGTVDDRM